MLKKTKQNTLKAKPAITTVTAESKVDLTKPVTKTPVQNTAPQKFPLILPKINTNDKKGKFCTY